MIGILSKVIASFILFCGIASASFMADSRLESNADLTTDSTLKAESSDSTLQVIKSAHNHLNLKDSYQKALQNSDGLKASKSAVDKARKLKSGAYMLFAPSVDIMGNYTFMEKTSIGIDLPPQVALMGLPTTLSMDLHKNHFAFGVINAMYPLYTGGKRLYALKMADLNIQDSEFLMQLNQINIFEKVIKAYFGVKLNAEVYQTLRSVEMSALAHLNNAKMLQENGQIAKIEYLSAKVEYDKAKNKAFEARNALDIALLSFKTILHDEAIMQSVTLDENGEIINLTLTSQLDISTSPLKSLQSYKDMAIASYPALKSIEIKRLQAQELSKIELSSFMPTIGLYGGYVIKDNNTMLNRAIPSWFVGVSAKLSLISTSGRIFKYQASKIAQNEVSYLHSQAKSDILLLIETTYKEVLSAKESFINNTSTIQLASENLKLQEEAFINGMASTVQVSDARNQLSFAKIQAQNAKYAYIVALAKLYAVSNDIDGFFKFY